MDTNNKIYEDIEDVINSGSLIDEVKTPPFFKDKTLHLLFAEDIKESSTVWSWFSPSLQMATLVVVVVLNVFTITNLDSSSSNNDIDEFAKTYSLTESEYQSVFN